MSGCGISVIIPVYNRAHLAPRAIRSALEQHGDAPDEIVLVDDASTDGTREAVKPLLRRQDRLICLDENRGVAGARNAGLEVATGRWVALLDSDDEWFPHKLATMLSSGLLDDHTILTHRCAIREPLLERVAPRRLFDGKMPLAEYLYLRSGDIAPSAMLGPTKRLKELRFEETMKNYEDFELLFRWQKAGLKIKMLPDVLARRYQNHGGPAVGKKPQHASQRLLLERHGAEFLPPARRMFETEYRMQELASQHRLWTLIVESFQGRYGWLDRPRRTLTVLLVGLFPNSMHRLRSLVHRAKAITLAALLGVASAGCGKSGPEPYFPPTPIDGVCANVPDATQLDAMVELGLRSFRDDCRWAWVEKEKGVLNMPEKLDRMVSQGVERGLAPLLILDYANRHYDDGGYPESAEAISAFARFAEFTARHFHGRVWMYELWNEWNIGFGMGRKSGTPQWYARLSRAVDEALARVDPRIRLIGGALSGDGMWHGEAQELLNLGAHGHWDGFSIHPYVFDRRTERKTAERVMEKAFGLSAVFSKDLPIYITETGWPTHDGDGGSSEQFAAAQAARLFILSRIHNPRGGVWWYTIQDGRGTPKKPGHRHGLLDPDGAVKPAGLAVKTVLAALSHRRLGRSLATGQAGVTAYECTNRATRRRGVVFWNFPGTQSLPVDFRRADGGPLTAADLTDLGTGANSVISSDDLGTVRVWSAMTPQLLEPTLESGFKALRPAAPAAGEAVGQTNAQRQSSEESEHP